MKLPPKVILHVGMEKAASTSIQNFLEAHRADLLTQRMLFPTSVFTRKVADEQERTSGHLELLRDLVSGDISAFEAEIAAHKGQVDTLILSAENLFHYPDPAALGMLADLLSGCEVTLIAILRHQEEWLLSYYNESVANGWNAETRSIDRFTLDQIESGKLDYSAIMDHLIGIFKPDVTRVLSFNALRKTAAILPEFCTAAGISFDANDMKAAPRSHVTTTSPEALEAHRRLNLIAAGFWSSDMHEWSKSMRTMAHLDTVERQAPNGYHLPSQEVRAQMQQYVWTSNRDLSHRFLQDQPFDIDQNWPRKDNPPLDEKLVQSLWVMGLDLFLETRTNAPAMRAKPKKTHQFPLPLLLDTDETRAVSAGLQAAQVTLTYSAGAPTLMAACLPNVTGSKLIYSVTQDPEWAIIFQDKLDHLDLPITPIIYHPPTAKPTADDYALSIWSEPFFRHPDLVLIDGQFRAACLVATCMQITKPVTVLFDGYVDNPAYHVVERMAKPVKTIGQMAEFQLQPLKQESWMQDFLIDLFPPISPVASHGDHR